MEQAGWIRDALSSNRKIASSDGQGWPTSLSPVSDMGNNEDKGLEVSEGSQLCSWRKTMGPGTKRPSEARGTTKLWRLRKED